MSPASLPLTPTLAPPAPFAGEAFGNEHVADIETVGVDGRQGAAVAIETVAVQIKARAGYQLDQARRGVQRPLPLGGATAGNFRRVDSFNANFLASEPQRVAVDHAGDAFVYAAHADRFGSTRSTRPHRQQKTSQHSGKSDHQKRLPRHIGTFDGEALRRAGSKPQTISTLPKDFASAFAVLTFCVAVGFLMVGIVLPDFPR